MTEKFYVTTPIYYVNDQPHLGHAYSTLMADVLARAERQLLGADNVWFLTGTDEHGAKVAEKAAEQEMPVDVFVSKISEQFRQTWKNLAISNNDFLRTTEERHEQAVGKIMARLRAAETPKGAEVLYKGTYEGLYCLGCERFLTERELVDGKCPLHPNQEPQQIKEANWFFRLTDYLPQIEDLIRRDEIKIIPETRKNEALGLLAQGLTDFSVSREKVKWGIPMPWDPEQTIYVWVEALMNYITAIGYPTDEKRWSEWWPADVQILAPDILKFHAIIWPAILLALKLPMPKQLFVHGFFTVDGQKMSKSLGNVIDPNVLIERYGVDATRYLLLSQFSFGSESDIKIGDFTKRYNADLANGLGNLVARLTNLAEKYLPANTVIPNIEREIKYNILRFFQKAQIREAIIGINLLIAACDINIDENKPWELSKSNPEELITFLTEQLSELKLIGELYQPIMPGISKRIADIFSTNSIKKPDNLFPRLEEDDESKRARLEEETNQQL